MIVLIILKENNFRHTLIKFFYATMNKSDPSSLPGTIAIFIENYIFPVLFIGFSINHFITLIKNGGRAVSLLSEKSLNTFTLNDLITLSDFLILSAVIVFNLLLAYGLMARGKLHKKPEGFQEIFIPFIATFWTFLYNIVVYIPDEINYILVPRNFLLISVFVGSIFAFGGLLVASIALMQLRKSFGIFVQVRDIVTKGLYRYVRHPMYFAHIMIHCGFLLITPRFGYLVLSLSLIAVTIYRARLEERKLAAHSKEYQQYMKHTPFIIPIKLR